MILWLLLGLLLAPTLFAVLSRSIARRGKQRSAALVAVAGFAGCIACVLALRWLPLGTESLGPLQILVPSPDMVVARESLLDRQQDAAAGAVQQPAAASPGISAERTAAPEAPSALPSRPEAPSAPPSRPEAPTALPGRPEATAAPQPTSLPEAPSALPGLPEPTAEPTSLPEPTVEPTAEPDPTAEAETEPGAEPVRYVVEPGDTLRGIAALYDVESAELQRYNGLSDEEADSLQIGQLLFIPPN